MTHHMNDQRKEWELEPKPRKRARLKQLNKRNRLMKRWREGKK